MTSITALGSFLVLSVFLDLRYLAEAYNILILFPTPSYSHQVPAMTLTEKLIEKGHTVTVVSPNRVPGLGKNYTYIDQSLAYRFVSSETEPESMDLQKQMTKWDLVGTVKFVVLMLNESYLCDEFLRFQRRVREEKIEYDVVITESSSPNFLVPMAIALAGPKPIIALTSLSANALIENHLGSIEHYSFIPSIYGEYSDKMNFWQKVENWFSNNYILYYAIQEQIDFSKDFFRKYYGEKIEALVEDAFNKITLLILSSNFISYYPRILGPNVIEVGALHIKPPERLPQHLQEWCDEAEKGVIYMSLGSNMKSKSLPANVRANFLRIFKELSAGYRVLWKWEADGKIPGQPNNTLAQKWFPQQSVLAHPKIKLFITQGGLQSFQEAIHYGVPTLGIPWFGDQELNSVRMVNTGIGLKIRPQELGSYEKIKKSVHALLFNESYSDNMRRISAISKDFTARSLDTAVFWVEHVAKHGDAEHLRPVTAHTTYFEYFCWDLLLVFLVISVLGLYLCYTVFKVLLLLSSFRITLKIKNS